MYETPEGERSVPLIAHAPATAVVIDAASRSRGTGVTVGGVDVATEYEIATGSQTPGLLVLWADVVSGRFAVSVESGNDSAHHALAEGSRLRAWVSSEGTRSFSSRSEEGAAAMYGLVFHVDADLGLPLEFEVNT